MEKSRYYRHIVNKISSAKKAADDMVQDIEHPGLEGELRELALKDCIEPFLTQSFKVGTGKVIDTYQVLSDQIDAIIYHSKLVPPIFFSKDLGLFPKSNLMARSYMAVHLQMYFSLLAVIFQVRRSIDS